MVGFVKKLLKFKAYFRNPTTPFPAVWQFGEELEN